MMAAQEEYKRPANFHALVVRLIELGYHPVPIPAGHKGPTLAGWNTLHMTTDQVPQYFPDAGMLVGILHDNNCVLDIDIYDPELSAKICAEARRRFPGALERVGQEPKSAFFLRMDAPGFKVSNTMRGQHITSDGEVYTGQVEVRTITRQAVVYGKHPDTGKPYKWVNGRELWKTPLHDLPLAVAADVQDFRDWCEVQINEWSDEPQASATVFDFESFRQPSFGDERASEDAFRAALAYAPANCGHDEWVNALMGIHDFYNGSQAGLQVAQQWSSDYPDYKPREVEQKWRSFEAGKGISYKTIFQIAKMNGADMTAIARIDRPAPKMIEPPKQDSALPVETKPAGIVDEELTDWIFLSADNEFYNPDTGETMSVAAFNLSKLPITPSVETGIDKDGEPVFKKLAPARTLVEYLNGQIAKGTMYRPDLADTAFFVDGIKYINSYMPSSVPKADPDWNNNDAWRTCDAHIRNIMGDDAEIIIQWMAHNVQQPGIKILWAPVIVGVQGDGKTTIAKMLTAAMGIRNVSPVSIEAIFSDFTSWAAGSCVKVLEEIRVVGNSRHDVMSKLKPLITNDQIECIRKGRDGAQVLNVSNYLALTNHMDALALDDGDRRWGVFKTRFDHRAHMLDELDDAYWERLHSAIDANPEAIRGWLLNVDISGFNRVAGPKTSAHKAAMIAATKPADQQDVEAAIETGWHGVHQDVVATDCLGQAVRDLTGTRLNTSRLARALDLAGFIKVDEVIKWNGKTRRLYRRAGAGIDSKTNVELREILDTTDAEPGVF